jgi:hypothetical protein
MSVFHVVIHDPTGKHEVGDLAPPEVARWLPSVGGHVIQATTQEQGVCHWAVSHRGHCGIYLVPGTYDLDWLAKLVSNKKEPWTAQNNRLVAAGMFGCAASSLGQSPQVTAVAEGGVAWARGSARVTVGGATHFGYALAVNGCNHARVALLAIGCTRV